MYFWNLKELKATLVARTLTDREALPYLTILLALYALAGAFPPEQPLNVFDHAGYITTVIWTALGTIYAYLKNGGQSGRDFLQRYLSLSWVLTVRLFAFVLPSLLIYGAVGNGFSDETTAGLYLITEALQLLFYWWLGREISDVAKRSSEHRESSAA